MLNIYYHDCDCRLNSYNFSCKKSSFVYNWRKWLLNENKIIIKFMSQQPFISHDLSLFHFNGYKDKVKCHELASLSMNIVSFHSFLRMKVSSSILCFFIIVTCELIVILEFILKVECIKNKQQIIWTPYKQAFQVTLTQAAISSHLIQQVLQNEYYLFLSLNKRIHY